MKKYNAGVNPRTGANNVVFGLVVCAAVGLRLLLAWTGVREGLIERYSSVELLLVAPASSWRRAQEGLFRLTRGLSPYAGDVFRGSPLLLGLVASLEGLERVFRSTIGGATCNNTAFAQSSNPMEAQLEASMPKKRRPKLGRHERTSLAAGFIHSPLPDTIASFYLLNPVTVLQCVAWSGELLATVTVLALVVAAANGRVWVTAMAAALASSCWDTHLVVLLLPAALLLQRKIDTEVAQQEQPQQSGKGERNSTGAGNKDECEEGEEVRKERRNAAVCRMLGVGQGGYSRASCPEWACIWGLLWRFLLSTAVVLTLLGLGLMKGQWRFLMHGWNASWRFDLTPNTGIYWYFFSETFARFGGYFSLVFFTHPFCYAFPSTLRLGMFPVSLAHLLLLIFGIFRSAPTLGDFVMCLCLLSMHPLTVARMKMKPFLALGVFVPISLLPVMLHLWLEAGTANANYFYFQGLVTNVFHCLIVLQFMAALSVRRKALSMEASKLL